MSTKFRRAGALGGITLIMAVSSGVAPATAAIADPAAVLVNLTVTTKVDNQGHGTARPDSFVFHVYDDNDGTEAASGIWDRDGTTVVPLPPGTYSVYEDPLAPYSEHVSRCAGITVNVGQPAACTVANIWTFARILVTTAVDNAGGGTATPSSFHYRVVDANDGSQVKSGTFNASGTTTLKLPDGTYTITEDELEGYTEDFSGCANVSIDYQNSGACIIANKFKPSTGTSGPPTTLPGGTQVTIHGSATSTTSCLTTLTPPLQQPTQTPITMTLETDAFAQPHKGDPITLSNTEVTVSIPGSLVKQGVDLGFVHVGDVIPANATLVLTGDGTLEKSHTYTFPQRPKITAAGGEIQPLVAKASLPDTTWTPENDTNPVFFFEKTLTIVSTINLGATIGTVTNTFDCEPTAQLVALSAQGSAPPTTGPGTGPAGSGSGGNPSGQATGGILPVTGPNVWLWLAPAALFISLGLFGIGATTRKRRRILG